MRTPEQIPPGSAIRVKRRYGECGSVNTSRQMPTVAIRADRTNQVRTLCTLRGSVGTVLRYGDVERSPTLKGRDTVDLPVPKSCAQPSFLPSEKRNVINVAGDEAMPNIPV